MEEKEITNKLKESVHKLDIYNNLRVVRNRVTYMDSEGCYTSYDSGFALVNEGTSPYVLFDKDERKFVSRKKGKLNYLSNLGLSILTGMVGGGSLPIKPTKAEIIAEVRGEKINCHTNNPQVIKTIKNLGSALAN